jgi:hypothetical protein
MSLVLPKYPSIEMFVNRWGWTRNIVPKIILTDDLGSCGAYDLNTRIINIKNGMSEVDTLITLVHELRHMWQHLEQKTISLKTDFKPFGVLIEYVQQPHESDSFQVEYDFYFEVCNGQGSSFEWQYRQLFEYGIIF